MMSIQEVYEKYKHLDKLLSDQEWLDSLNIQSLILYDLWQAIKLAVESKSESCKKGEIKA